jgi:exopolyphosphatase/pppGpp-phosphohydrolase
MNIASIDIGTNTVLALFAETNGKGDLKALRNEYRMPRLG